MSTGHRQLAAVRARQQERQHMAYRLREDAHTSAGHPDQPHVRVGGGQPRGWVPDRHQQPVGHIHRDELVSRHAHRSHGPVRSRLNAVDPRQNPDSRDPLASLLNRVATPSTICDTMPGAKKPKIIFLKHFRCSMTNQIPTFSVPTAGIVSIATSFNS